MLAQEQKFVCTTPPTIPSHHTCFHRLLSLSCPARRPDLTSEEREQVLQNLMREIAALWQTDELRRQRPTPVDGECGAMMLQKVGVAAGQLSHAAATVTAEHWGGT